MLSVAFITQGCKVNQYETQAMRELFAEQGYNIVDEKEADIYVINTCTVTHTTDQKARQIIRKIDRQNPNAFIIVTGCYANREPKTISQIDGVDLVLPNCEKSRIVDYLKNDDLINAEVESERDTRLDFHISRFSEQTRAFIKIQDGCDSFCSYCIIPYVRGRTISRSISDIVTEVKRLSKNGYKEVVLTGIHLLNYGKDFPEHINIVDVIDKIESIEGIERIRLSSIEPIDIKNEIVDQLANFDKLMPHFHISLQSGSDEILNLMRRRYTTKQYAALVNKIRVLLPKVGITSDIMVGFPGEEDRHFNETCQFIKAMEFSQLHVFRYSRRPGTLAADFRNQVPPKIAIKRSQIVRDIGSKLYTEFRQKMLGHKMKVLVEDCREGKENWLAGFTDNYIRTIVNIPENLINQIIPVKLIKIEDDLVVASQISY